MTCTTCGTHVRAGEFHPYVFCVLREARVDPWLAILEVNEMLGLDVTHWPADPPLIKDLEKAPLGRVAVASGPLLEDSGTEA